MNIEEYISRNKKVITTVLVTNIVLFTLFVFVFVFFITANRTSIGAYLLGGSVGEDIRTGEPVITRYIIGEENRIVEIVEKDKLEEYKTLLLK